MNQEHQFINSRFVIGDTVLIKRIPEALLIDLPEEDQEAIRACAGQLLSISGFDVYGQAEIEFFDLQGNLHTIWIQTDCLELGKA